MKISKDKIIANCNFEPYRERLEQLISELEQTRGMTSPLKLKYIQELSLNQEERYRVLIFKQITNIYHLNISPNVALDIFCQEIQEEVDQVFRDRGLQKHSEALLSLSSEAVQGLMMGGDNTPIGSSRIGGGPDVPDNFSWPQVVDEEGMAFICQLNLNELAEYDLKSLLPSNGMLYFFSHFEAYFSEDPVQTCYYFNMPKVDLKPLPPPSDVGDEFLFDSSKIQFGLLFNLPHVDFVAVDTLELTSKEKQSYREILRELEKGQVTEFSSPLKLLLNAGETTYLTQNPHLLNRVEHDKNSPSLISLMKVENDQDLYIYWGEDQHIEYLISLDDLRNNNFQNTWLYYD